MLILEFTIRIFVLLALPYGYVLIKKYNLDKIIKDAVWGADQLLKKEDPTGEKRKAFVKKYILDRFKIDEADLQILMEAYVKQLNIEQKRALE